MGSGNYSFSPSNIGKNGYVIWLNSAFGKRLIIGAATYGRTESDIITDSICDLLKIENNNDVGVCIIDTEYCFISLTDRLSKMLNVLTGVVNKSLNRNFTEPDLIGFHLLKYLGVEVDLSFSAYHVEVSE